MAKPAPRTGIAEHPYSLPPFLYNLAVPMEFLPPATVLPEQFHRLTVNDSSRGEVALMRAVLVDAVECLHLQADTRSPAARRLAREAEQWLFADDDRWPFSFVNICTVLGLNPAYVRRGLRSSRQVPLARPIARRLQWRAARRSSRIAA